MLSHHPSSAGSYNQTANPNIQSSFIDLQYKSIFTDIPTSKSLPDYNEEIFDKSIYERSIIDEFDTNIELFLPKSLLSEIDNQQNSSASTELDTCAYLNSPTSGTISSEKLESILSHNPEKAKKIISDIVNNQNDPKEQGKTLRNAAEIAKRMADTAISLDLYEMATLHDPTTPSSWIDRAKLLDELGEYEKADAILRDGIFSVPHCELLIRKLLRSFERSNKIDSARSFIGSIIKNQYIDQQSVLVEGALFEIRQGRIDPALLILHSIKEKVGWKPNIYSELVQFFERSGMILKKFDIVEEGARLNPRNAIICQSLLKNQKNPKKMIEILQESSKKWTNEFTDKMTTVVCESLAANGHIQLMRNLLSESVYSCLPKQRYKLLFSAATIELMHGNPSFAPLILNITLNMTPYKSKPMVLILIAKVFELNREYDKALSIFEKASVEFSAEWRIFLELAQFHVHRNNVEKAIDVLTSALKMHNGSGRLWAFRVQLESFHSVESQITILKNAIQAVPKSGEVWCEAARIALNPLTKFFNIQCAKQFLEFAYKFTPQHGDSLVEMLRAEMLEKGMFANFDEIKKKFICSEGNYGLLFIYLRKAYDRPLTDVFEDALKEVREDITNNRKAYSRAIARSSFVVRSVFEEEERFKKCKEEYGSSAFAFGLTKVGKLMLDPSLCKSPEQLLSIVLGTSAFGQ